jgi:dihydroxyacetone kinase-like protein
VKKFVNNPREFVPEMLKGIALANPGTLKYVPEFNLIMRTDAPRDDKVSVIQGSGSGHEPAHVMVVGRGSSTPPAPVTCSPRRRWTTCWRPASCWPRPRACCTS